MTCAVPPRIARPHPGLALLGLLALAPASALAIINPRFTPVHLVRQADAILAGTLQPGARADEWTLAGIETLKGAAQPEAILTLAPGEGDALAGVRKLLAAGQNAPAMLFSAARDGEKQAFLHSQGVWLTLRAGERGRWAIHGIARQMDAVYAGGTDMLLRMTRYVLADPRATVPASVGTGWAGRSRIATMDANVSGMAAIEVGTHSKRNVAGDTFETECVPQVFVYYNDITDATGLRLRLPKGATGPLTASVWQGAVCVGTYPLHGHAPAAFASLRHPGECVVRYRFPRRPARERKLTVGEGARDVLLDE